MTNRNELLALIKSLRPIETDKPLIRIGPELDGGYLVPNDLMDIAVLISPGIDKESRFELECAEMGIKVHLIDASVKGPSLEHSQFVFHAKYMGGGLN